MKSSNFAKKILFVLLFSALTLFVACGSSANENEELTDTDTVSDKDTSDDSGHAGDTDSETSEDAETTPDNDENAETNDSEINEQTDSNTEPTTDEDSSSEITDNDSENSEPTNPTDPTDPTIEPDPEFEQNAEGCTMIEVPKITMGGSHADEINGYFSPAMGESSIDIIRMYLLGEIEEGIYELGTGLNDNYAQCKQCVMVWVDAALATANEYYFQTAGTMEITEVRDVDGIQRTVGRISNLILKQVEPLNDYLGDFGFISDGGCIAAEIVEWDTTNTPGNTGD